MTAAVLLGGLELRELPEGRLQVASPLGGVLVTARDEFLALLNDDHRGRVVIAFHEAHELWCDPATHAVVAEEDPGRLVGCVGLPVGAEDGVGGWWHQEAPDSPATFILSGRGGLYELSVTDVQHAAAGSQVVGLPADDEIRRVMRLALGQNAGEQLGAIIRDLDATGEAWVASGGGFDTPEHEAREAVFARLKAWSTARS